MYKQSRQSGMCQTSTRNLKEKELTDVKFKNTELSILTYIEL